MEMIKTAWAMLDGWKTYIGGVGLMLSGAGLVLADAVKIETGADAIAFATALPTHPGVITFLAGWTAVGLGHKVEKAKAAAVVVNNNTTIVTPKKGKTRK